MKRNFEIHVLLTFALCAFLLSSGWAQTTGSPADPAASIAPLQQWKSAVLAGDAAGLKALYSTNPAARVDANSAASDAAGDASFWLALKGQSMKIHIVRYTTPRPEIEHVICVAEVASGSPGGHVVTVSNDQVWQKQDEQWRIVGVTRADAPQLKQPSDMNKIIYPANVDAVAELKEAGERAGREHKRVLLVFGANWCYDCHVLDLAFQRADLAQVLAASYEVVHVDLGPDEHKNADLVKRYEVPLNKGIPALAVAESDGKLVVSQKNGEFENARALTPEALLEFVEKWKPQVT